MNTKFNCPHCNAAIEAESTKTSLAGECPACEQPIIVPARSAKRASPKAVAVSAALPSFTRWTKPKHEISCKIAEITQHLDECLSHPDEYPCYQCNTWVKPFFDYEQVSSGGVALTNEYGMTLYHPNTTTQERVRCRNCGKFLAASGAAMAHRCSPLLKKAQKRFLDLQHQESRWHELNQLAKSRPYLATFLRMRPAKVFVTVVLIGSCVLLFQYLAAQYEQGQQETAQREQAAQRSNQAAHREQKEQQKAKRKKEKAAQLLLDSMKQ